VSSSFDDRELSWLAHDLRGPLAVIRGYAELPRTRDDDSIRRDAPVLIESGASGAMDRLVVVVSDEATQARRLIARDALDPAEAEQRIASQMPVAAKAKLAHYVVDNSGDREATIAEVRRVHAALLADLKARGRAGD